jgi:hypothetical protein
VIQSGLEFVEGTRVRAMVNQAQLCAAVATALGTDLTGGQNHAKHDVTTAAG